MIDSVRKVVTHKMGSDCQGFLESSFSWWSSCSEVPCKNCRNYKFLTQDEVQVHLYKKGFMLNYLVWRDHSEVEPPAVGSTR
jgi:hypothetical protein